MRDGDAGGGGGGAVEESEVVEFVFGGDRSDGVVGEEETWSEKEEDR